MREFQPALCSWARCLADCIRRDLSVEDTLQIIQLTCQLQNDI